MICLSMISKTNLHCCFSSVDDFRFPGHLSFLQKGFHRDFRFMQRKSAEKSESGGQSSPLSLPLWQRVFLREGGANSIKSKQTHHTVADVVFLNYCFL